MVSISIRLFPISMLMTLRGPVLRFEFSLLLFLPDTGAGCGPLSEDLYGRKIFPTLGFVHL